MDQQKQPVAPDTKTAAGTPPPPPQKGNIAQDQGSKQASPVSGNQPPAPKEAIPPASGTAKAL
jgi:hypothetical protein